MNLNLENWQDYPAITGIKNLKSIDERLFCAGQIESKEAIQSLRDLGVDVFIDLKKPDECAGSLRDYAWIKEKGGRYYNYPIANPASDIDFSLHHLVSDLLDREEKILIYCVSSNRVGYWFGRFLYDCVGISRAQSLKMAQAAGLAAESSIASFKAEVMKD